MDLSTPTPANPLVQRVIDDIYDLPNMDEGPAWKLTGPKRLTETFRNMAYNDITIYPSHYFLPSHFTGKKYGGDGQVFAKQLWSSTREVIIAEQNARDAKKNLRQTNRINCWMSAGVLPSQLPSPPRLSDRAASTPLQVRRTEPATPATSFSGLRRSLDSQYHQRTPLLRILAARFAAQKSLVMANDHAVFHGNIRSPHALWIVKQMPDN